MTVSLVQKYFLERNERGLYSCFAVGAKLSKVVNEICLEDALGKLVQKRRALRLSTYNGEDEEITFPVSEVISYMNEPDISKALYEIHGTIFPVNQRLPQWKIFAADKWLIFACNHVFFDGTGAALVVEDLVTLLNGDEISDDADLTDLYISLAIPSWSIFIKSVLADFPKIFRIPFIFKSKDACPALEPMKNFRTQNCIIQINSEDFSKIKKFTKRENMSFTELFSAIGYLSLESLAPKAQIDIIIPVNQRRVLGNSRAYGTYVSDLNLSVPKGISTWSALKNAVAIKRSQFEPSLQYVGMLKYVNMTKFIESIASRTIQDNKIEISNLGLRDPITGEYDVSEYIFSQPLNVVSNVFNSSVVSSSTMTNIVVTVSPDASNFAEYVHNLKQLISKVIELPNDAAITIDDCRSVLVRKS